MLILGLLAATIAVKGGVSAQPVGGANSAVNPAVSGQQVLDLFATLPLPSAPASPKAPHRPNGPFSSWTPEDQAAIPTQIGRICELVWIMAHDAPGTRVLPAQSPDSDEMAIGVEICVAGHMPRDWPKRMEKIDTANAILRRARAFGSALILPSAITR